MSDHRGGTMHRMMALSIVALLSSALPAAAQDRSNEKYAAGDVGGKNYPKRDDSRLVRIPAGTNISVTVNEEIPVERHRFGDTFDAKVTRDVVVKGKVVIPAGAPAKVKLVESSEKANAASVRLSDVQVNGKMRDVTGSDARADTEKSGLSTGEKTAVGAAAGAVVGAVTGAGVVEGAVVGAGGGLAWGLLSDRGEKIDDGTTLRFELEDELQTN
jgi:hypothetical protein